MSMDNEIILSICISAYNRRDITCENVRKILQYEGDDIEVIVSDNASEDGTFEALKQIEDKRLRVYRNEINVGLGGNTIRLLTYAAGKYVLTTNEWNWIDHQDIKAFVKVYRKRECDFILSINDKDPYEAIKDRIERKCLLLLRFGHPGLWVVRRTIYNELITRVNNIELEAYTEEWLRDMSCLRMALCLYAERWERFRGLVRWPNPDRMARIEQLRGKSDEEKIFFTPAARILRFRLWLDNSYIKSDDMKKYITAVYRENIYCSLSLFCSFRHAPQYVARYHYKWEKSVSWIKIAVNFYKKAMPALKEQDLFTYSLAVRLGVVTIQEYIRLCKLRLKYWLNLIGIGV